MRDDASVLRELWNPGVTQRESCSCGAVFETTTFALSARKREIDEFREAHRVCREKAVAAASGVQG